MKTYHRPSVKVIATVFIAFTVISLSLLIYALITENWFAFIGMTVFWVLFGGFLTFIWFYESRSILELTGTEIRFFYKTFSKSKELNGLNRKGLVIRFDAIEEIDIVTFRGDWLIAANTKHLVFRWKDGREAQVYLYHFGNGPEKEIIERLEKRVKTSRHTLP
jgi:hypothetical protein